MSGAQAGLAVFGGIVGEVRSFSGYVERLIGVCAFDYTAGQATKAQSNPLPD